MKKALAAGLIFIGLSTPAMAEEKIRHTDVYGAKHNQTWKVMSRNNNVVVLSVERDREDKFISDEITIDCTNNVMVADYTTHQNVWRADGNLWFVKVKINVLTTVQSETGTFLAV